MSEARHVDDKAQTGDGWRNHGRGIHEADRLDAGRLAKAMGVPRKHVNELCNDRRNVTAATALILARVFGNSAMFQFVQAELRLASAEAF
jgi:addiction module HigA family antidote